VHWARSPEAVARLGATNSRKANPSAEEGLLVNSRAASAGQLSAAKLEAL
jgi:hypothetical protein